MEQTAIALATCNAIRGAEQSDNIAKQQFAGMMENVRGLSWQFGRLDKQLIGSAA